MTVEEESQESEEENAVNEMQRIIEAEKKSKEDEQLRSKAGELVGGKFKELGVDIGSYAKKDEVMGAIEAMKAEFRKEMDEFKSLLLKAKAQGKAHFSEKKQDDTSELRRIYKGTGMFDDDEEEA